MGLVDDDGGVAAAVLGLTRARAVAACQTEAKISEPEQPGGVLAELAFGQAGDEDAAVVEDVGACRTLDVGGPMVARTKSRSRNDRSRARTGPMTWARSAGGVDSNHSQNPLRPSGSSRPAVNGARNCLSFSSGGDGDQGGVRGGASRSGRPRA